MVWADARRAADCRQGLHPCRGLARPLGGFLHSARWGAEAGGGLLAAGPGTFVGDKTLHIMRWMLSSGAKRHCSPLEVKSPGMVLYGSRGSLG